MNKHILEKVQIQPAFMPVAMNTADNTGDWVCMKNFFRCAIVFIGSVGTAGDDPTITVEQATDASGSGHKALNFTRVDTKVATDIATLGTFTQVTQAAGNTYTSGTLAEQQKVVVIDIDGTDLDANNNFDWIQASIADVGTNEQLGCAIYILHDPRDVTVPMASAIA